MDFYYLDTSAVVKRYVAERGSAWVNLLTDPQQYAFLFLSKLTLAEFVSALTRRQREGKLADAVYADLLRVFYADCQTQYQLIDLTDGIIMAATPLFERHPLRTLDALQLATALHAQRFILNNYQSTLTFVSADERLLSIARTEGLLTDNPNLHP